jgi:hypothetical protein
MNMKPTAFQIERAKVQGAAAGFRGEPYDDNPYPADQSELKLIWSQAHNGSRVRMVMDREGRDRDGAFIHGREA